MIVCLGNWDCKKIKTAAGPLLGIWNWRPEWSYMPGYYRVLLRTPGTNNLKRSSQIAHMYATSPRAEIAPIVVAVTALLIKRLDGASDLQRYERFRVAERGALSEYGGGRNYGGIALISEPGKPIDFDDQDDLEDWGPHDWLASSELIETL